MGCESLPLSAKLPRLARELAAYLPGYSLQAEPARPVGNWANCADVAHVEEVIATIGTRGGDAYVAMRAWNVLTWQSVLIAVLCAEAEGQAARVDRARYLGQAPFGCCLNFLPDQVADVRSVAATYLIRSIEATFDILSECLRIRPELARRQIADRVLGVLHRRARLGFASVAKTKSAAKAWLAALSLDGLSTLDPTPLEDGSEGLWLCRRSCCLEYRATPDFLCATCPRRDRTDRVALSQEEWRTHVRP